MQWTDATAPYHQLPQVQTVKTNAAGKAQVPVLDPVNWKASDKANGTTGTISVTKPFHGPIVPYGTPFRNGAGTAQLLYKPGAAPGQGTLSVVGLPPTQEVRWGRPRVIGATQNTLHLMLVEGGELGVEHANIRTRRLSSPHRQTTPPTPVSQIDEELLFHIAHGGLALDPASDFKFKIVQQPQPDGTTQPVHQLDLPAPPRGAVPTVPKLRIRNAVAGGLRIMHILRFQPQRSPAGYDILRLADTYNLNPRLVVGVVRLCRMLTGMGVRMMITVGFNRGGDRKFHGPGRAVDFSGVTMAHVIPLQDPDNAANTDPTDPHVAARQGKPPWVDVPITDKGVTTTHTVFQRGCVAEIDLIVDFHWGGPQLLVDTGGGATVRRSEDAKTYQHAGSPRSPEALLYRLSTLPLAAERSAAHVLTDAHYTLAGTVFLAAYQFFATEFSHRDSFLGPLPIPTVGTSALVRAQLAAAALDDTSAPGAAPVVTGAAPIVPGAIAGFVLHPDYPDPDSRNPPDANNPTGSLNPKRQTHRNHIHANVGARIGSPDSES